MKNKPPEMPKPTVTPEGLWDDTQHAVRALGSSLAGYLSLARNLVPQEGRAPSVPLLSFKGSVDGVKVEEVVVNCNTQTSPESSAVVTTALCTILREQLLDAIAKLNGLTLAFNEMFAPAPAPARPRKRSPEEALMAAAQPPAEQVEEEDSFDYEEVTEPEEAPAPPPAPVRRGVRPRHGN